MAKNIRTLIFNDEITLWWQLDGLKDVKNYACYLNGEKVTETSKTHVTFSGLNASAKYNVKIVCDNGKTLFSKTLATKNQKNVLDVTKAPFNAVADGSALATQGIQKALDACTENDVVYLPKGTYLSGALKMKSNTELYLDDGAVLQGTKDIKDYLPKIKSRFEGLEIMCYSALINAGEIDEKGGCNCKNIIIRGKGKVIGGGDELRVSVIELERERLKEYIAELGDKIKEYENENTIPGRARPRLINISNVDGVVVSGIEFGNGPSWNLHPVYSKNISIYNCLIRSHGVSNGDGIDPDSVDNCAIFDCKFDTGDDCIAVKSGKNPEGNIVNRKCSNVYIFDCQAFDGHSVAMGSEMSGGLENIFVWDCDFSKTIWGAHIKGTRKRGGFVREIYFDRCVLSRVVVRSVSYNDDGDGANTLPDFSKMYFNDCTISGGKDIKLNEKSSFKNIYINGFGEDCPIKDIYFNNVTIIADELEGQEIIINQAENIVFNGIKREQI